jgi:hypothetical protein
MDLGFDDHGPSQPVGDGGDLVGGGSDFSAWDRDAIFSQDGLGLILVDFHGGS